ncbi:MAG: hypothetical protein OEW11_07890 [Nitrospirota bacterium]|nr:hypothetical protein [Nitrospirota bacterium]
MAPSVTVVTLINDLLFQPKVEHGLRQAGYHAVRYRADVSVADLLHTDGPAAGLVDLDAGGSLAALTRLLGAGVPVVAFCGHTNEAQRGAARAAGVTVLASRGEVHGDLPGLIRKALAHVPDPDCDHC